MKIFRNQIWGFDHQKETWEALPPMLSRRVGAAANTSVPGIPVSPINHVAWVKAEAAAVAGCFYVCGGWDGRQFRPQKYGIQVSRLELENHKQSLDCFENGKLHFFLNITTSQLDVFSFRFLFFQGFLSASVCLPNCLSHVHRRLNSAERFNPMTGAWEALPPMQERRFLGLLISWKKQSNLGMFCPCWWNDTGWWFKNTAITTREV